MQAGSKWTASQFRHYLSIGTFSLHGGGDDVPRDDSLRIADKTRAAGYHVEIEGGASCRRKGCDRAHRHVYARQTVTSGQPVSAGEMMIGWRICRNLYSNKDRSQLTARKPRDATAIQCLLRIAIPVFVSRSHVRLSCELTVYQKRLQPGAARGPPMATQRPTLGSISSDVNAEQRDQDDAGDNDAEGHEGRYQAGANRR
jgi:hypothetical protein